MNEKINFIVERTTSTTRQDEPAPERHHPEKTQGIYANMETHIRSFQQTLKDS
jgi:hypothetical protein